MVALLWSRKAAPQSPTDDWCSMDSNILHVSLNSSSWDSSTLSVAEDWRRMQGAMVAMNDEAAASTAPVTAERAVVRRMQLMSTFISKRAISAGSQAEATDEMVERVDEATAIAAGDDGDATDAPKTERQFITQKLNKMVREGPTRH